MKKLLLFAAFSFLFFGCNMNPSKEARIQKLEASIQQSMEKIATLESSVQMLEVETKLLKTKIAEFEKQ